MYLAVSVGRVREARVLWRPGEVRGTCVRYVLVRVLQVRKIGHVVITGESRLPLRIGFGFCTGLGSCSACNPSSTFQVPTFTPSCLDLGLALDPFPMRVVIQLLD